MLNTTHVSKWTPSRALTSVSLPRYKEIDSSERSTCGGQELRGGGTSTNTATLAAAMEYMVDCIEAEGTELWQLDKDVYSIVLDLCFA